MTTGVWPLNRNHEAARRRVDQILRDHGRPGWRRETQVAELFEEMMRERDTLRDQCRNLPAADDPKFIHKLVRKMEEADGRANRAEGLARYYVNVLRGIAQWCPDSEWSRDRLEEGLKDVYQTASDALRTTGEGLLRCPHCGSEYMGQTPSPLTGEPGKPVAACRCDPEKPPISDVEGPVIPDAFKKGGNGWTH